MSSNVRQNGRFRAQLALASGASQKETAEAAGITPRTVRRWLDDPEFMAEVRNLRGELIEQAAGKLAGLASDAAVELGRLFTHGRSEMARLGAARALLEHVIPYRGSVDLEARFADLERKATFLAEQQ